MKANLKDSTKEYYESFNLTSKQLNQLESLEREHFFQSSRTSPNKSWFLPIATLVAGVFLVMYFKPTPDPELYPSGIASEIAYNYNKTLTPEFQGKSISEIKPHFSKLDFNLVSSKHNNISDFKLVGGRYCSINKQLAAQLRLVGNNNKDTVSWYQLPLPADQRMIKKNMEIYINGVKVIMWTEKGVLHVLARKN
jgi:hypothetical protein